MHTTLPGFVSPPLVSSLTGVIVHLDGLFEHAAVHEELLGGGVVADLGEVVPELEQVRRDVLFATCSL